MEQLRGGYMKLKSEFDNEEVFIEDKTSSSYRKAISKINEENLKKIAGDIGTKYIHMTNEKDRNLMLSDIKEEYVKAEDMQNSKRL